MTFGEARHHLLNQHADSPFIQDKQVPDTGREPCMRIRDDDIYNDVIGFLTKEGKIVFWQYPDKLLGEECPLREKEGSWIMDMWYVNEEPYEISNWVKENRCGNLE